MESKACLFLIIVGGHCRYQSLLESVEMFLTAVKEIFQKTGLPDQSNLRFLKKCSCCPHEISMKHFLTLECNNLFV